MNVQGPRSISDNLMQFIKIIKKETLPFENFVARRHFKDEVDINQPHSVIDIKIMRAIRSVSNNHIPRCIPILGPSGSGKTHYYWVLKELERKNEEDYEEMLSEEEVGKDFREQNGSSSEFLRWRSIYIPSPPAPIRIPLHILNCIFDEIGDEILDTVSFKIINKFGKSGRSGKRDKNYYNKLMAQALSYFGGSYSDILKGFIVYGSGLNSDKNNLAHRWLMGEVLSSEELDSLGVRMNIEDDDICFSLIKIIGEMFPFPLIFFFDEMELMHRVHGDKAEIRIWEIIKKLFNECHNILFISTCLLSVWDRIEKNLDDTVLSRFDPIAKLRPFRFNDTIYYYTESMKVFWRKHNNSFPDEILFPFSNETLNDIFIKSGGNPRHIIKLINITLEKFIDGEFSIDLISHNKWSRELLEEKISNREDLDLDLNLNFPDTNKKDFLNSELSEVNNAIRDLEGELISHLKDSDKFDLDKIFEKKTGINEIQLKKPEERTDTGTLLPVEEKSEEVYEKDVKIIINNDIYYFEIKPNVIYFTVSSILKHFSSFSGSSYEIEMEPQIKFKKTKKTIGLIYHLIERDEQIGIEIPNVKSFDVKNRISAYHSLIKMTEIIKRGIINKGIMIIPKKALIKGKQISKLLSSYQNDLLIIEITNFSAKNFIVEWNQTDNVINNGDAGALKKFIANNEIARKILGFISPEIDFLNGISSTP
ncbi:MAG: hypothetical protein ACTSWY_13725 [Promethearchaeota archaeon]